MRLVLQRVLEASVKVEGEVVGSIGRGVLALVGISANDLKEDAEWAVRRVLNTRLWEDGKGRAWGQSAAQGGLDVLLVSQFTLYCVLKGNKPDFHHAMPPDAARPYWDGFVESVRAAYPGGRVQQGRFGAMMQVGLINDGPVTIELTSPERPPAAPAPAAAPRPGHQRADAPPAREPDGDAGARADAEACLRVWESVQSMEVR